jgi:hypothetical protein
MNIDEVSQTLPNGFHDSELIRIEVDYEHCKAKLTFDLDLSDIETDEGGVRRGCLTLVGLVYLSIEPPAINGQIRLEETSIQSIVGGSSDFSELKHHPQLPEYLVNGAFRHWFYSSSDNNFVYVCYKSASFVWIELEK